MGPSDEQVLLFLVSGQLDRRSGSNGCRPWGLYGRDRRLRLTCARQAVAQTLRAASARLDAAVATGDARPADAMGARSARGGDRVRSPLARSADSLAVHRIVAYAVQLAAHALDLAAQAHCPELR